MIHPKSNNVLIAWPQRDGLPVRLLVLVWVPSLALPIRGCRQARVEPGGVERGGGVVRGEKSNLGGVMLEATAVCVLRRPRVACAGIVGRNPPSEATHPPAKILGLGRRHMWGQTPALPFSSVGRGHVTSPFWTSVFLCQVDFSSCFSCTLTFR